MRFIVLAVLFVALALPGCLRDVVGLDSNAGPKDFVSSKDYTKWVIEVDTIEGMAPPSNSAMTLLKSRLASVVDKPDGIEVRAGDTLPARGGTWTLKDITDYSSAHLNAKTGGNTAVTHLLFLDGKYKDENALGVAISSSRGGKVVSSGPIAIFSESIRGSCTLLNGCTSSALIWAPVLIHEFGHVMGLVNNGAPMVTNHEDSAHEGHSNSRQSVMYWEVETSNILNAFTGGIPDDYDANDRADLCALGGRC